MEVGYRTPCYVKSSIHRYLTVTLFSNQCNVFLYMFRFDYSRVPRARSTYNKVKSHLLSHHLLLGVLQLPRRGHHQHIPRLIPWRRGFCELRRRRKRCFKKKEKQSCGFDGRLITFQTSQARQDRSD